MTDVARTYTPALAGLMEHGKVIEQGLGTCIDVTIMVLHYEAAS
jgi:hypothetical protein